MDKKFYEIPESEVIDLLMEAPLLAGSDLDDEGGAAGDIGVVPPGGGTDPNPD